MNEFLKKHARQNQDVDVGRTYVALSGARVVGFFTLSVGSVAREALQNDEAKRLPRYPVPSAHLGRLAVDLSSRGRGLGARLLIRAMEIVVQVADVIGIHVLEVRAKDASARAFYEHFGFKRVLDDEFHLYLSLKAVRRALSR
ncbi:MAG: GNAT family N-acetyltransferase [Archangium sp.]